MAIAIDEHAAAAPRPWAAPPRPESAADVEPRRAAHAWLFVIAAMSALVLLLVRQSIAGQVSQAAGKWREALPLAHAAALIPAVEAVRRDVRDTREVRDAREAPRGPRADARLRHDGYASIHGGVLYTPASFSSEDGAYDLVLHFHGNVKVVVESAEVAHVNAAVAVVNLGVGSAPYEDAYAVPGTYEALLDEVQHAVEARGVAHAKLRRLALSSWSAGYGALSTILDLRRGTDPLDAILVMDGIHCGFLEERPDAVNHRQLASFAKAARAAAAGDLLFTITHSEIDPITYASSTATASYLLGLVGGERFPSDLLADTPPHVELVSARGAVAKRLEKWMIPTTEARVGRLHVRGFRGETPEHHMAHLLQMGATVLPELAARWSEGGE